MAGWLHGLVPQLVPSFRGAVAHVGMNKSLHDHPFQMYQAHSRFPDHVQQSEYFIKSQKRLVFSVPLTIRTRIMT